TEEVDRPAEVRFARRVLELTAEVGRVEEVERLEEEAEFLVLAKAEELRDAQVHLLEAVAAHGVRRQVVLVVAIARVAVNRHAVAVDIAAARREDAVGAWACELQDRRELEAPLQVEDAGQNEAMAFICIGRAEVLGRVPLVEHVLRLVAEIRSLAE